MNTPRRSIRLTDQQVAALDELARRLSISGQRGSTLNPLIAWIADVADAAMSETAASLEIAGGCAAGGDWDELIEGARLMYTDSRNASEFDSSDALAAAVSADSHRGFWYDGPNSTNIVDWIAEGDIDDDATVAELAQEWDE